MRKCFSKAITAFILFVAATAATSQNVIIENEYVRAGVNMSTGTMGSGGSTRPGLQYDNTGTHTWPCGTCQGDYLTPGSPFEGFTVRLENSAGTLIRSYTNNNTGSANISGGAWVGTPTASSAVWTATTSDFSITNTYSLPSGQRYIDINTGITANVAIGRLYFGRFIDPDAMPMTGDTSATDNVLGYGAIPTRNVAFAEATVSRYALGLYSAAANVGAGIGGGANNWTTNPVIYYNGYSPYTSGGATVNYGRGDHTIGLGFLVNNVAVGDIVNFRYAYIFGPNAFGAANYAITGGAGGGTAGLVPGGGTLVDVGSATSAAATPSAPSAPTVTGTTTTNIVTTTTVNGTPVVNTVTAVPVDARTGFNYTQQTVDTATTTTPVTTTTTTVPRTVTTYSDGTSTTVNGTAVVTTASTTAVSVTTTTTTVNEAVETSLPVIVASVAHHTPSETATTQTIARETTVNTTTPITRTTNTVVVTDGVTVSNTNATPVLLNNVDTTVTNESFSGRIDQQAKLDNLNVAINRSLNMDPFRMDVYRSEDGEKSFFLRSGRQSTTIGDGYNASSNMYNIGGDFKFKHNWRLGAQYSQVNTLLNGIDSTTTQGKAAGGVYSIYTFANGNILSTNLGYAKNNIASRRTVEGVFNNAHVTNGTDTWISNRLYIAPLPTNTAEIRPYVGVTTGTTRLNGYTESGDIQSARTVDGVNNTLTYTEAGVRVAKTVGRITYSGDASTTSNGYRNTEVGVAFSPARDQSIGIYGSKQQKDDVATTSWFVRGMMRF
jgi:hypothetical protein